MLSECNAVLRERFPGTHRLLKRASQRWREGGAGVPPTLNWYRGRALFTHPRFLTWDLEALDRIVPKWIALTATNASAFFDVGANFGWFTWYAAMCVGKRGSVVAFEPSIANLEILKYHVKVNRLKNVAIVPKAVSDKTEDAVPFYLLEGGVSASNSLTIKSDTCPRLHGLIQTLTSVGTTSIDDFVEAARIIPSVIKIDVEGAELLVVNGSVNTLKRYRPTVIIAVHPFWLPDGQTTEMIDEAFASLGYTVTDGAGMRVTRVGEGDYLCRP